MSRILVIDDEAEFRMAVKAALRATQAEVLEAGDAEGGLQMARTRRPDLVLCDLNLGSGSGWDVLAALRADRRTATIPLILMTASTAPSAMRQSMDLGADDFLKKPFTTEEMLAAVKARLRQQEMSRAESGRALRDSESRFRAIADAVEDAIIIMAPDERISFWNPAAERMFGYTEAEAISLSMRALLASGQSNAAHDPAFPFLQWAGRGADIGRTLELAARHKDGREFPVEISLSTVSLDGHWHAVGIFRSIAERKQAEEAMRRSEIKFRTLYDSTGDAVMLLDPRGFFDCNQATLTIFGCASREAFCSTHPADLSPPVQPDGTASLALANQHIATAMEKGSHRFEWMHRRADTGQTFPAEVLLTAMELDGKPVLQGVVRDITERKRAEDQLRQLSRAVEQSPASIVITDSTGRIEYVNPCFEKVAGFSAAEAIGQNPRVLKSGEHPVEFYRELWNTITAGKEWTGEFRNRTKSGEDYWEQASISPVRDPAGRITHFVAVKQDITERKRGERILHDSQELYSSLVENLPQCVFRKDREGRFVFCNRRFCETVGRSLEEIVGQTDADLFPPKLAAAYRQDDLRVMDSGQTLEQVEENVGADGRKLFVQVVKTPLRDASGAVIGIQGIFWDITERKRAEAALRESEEHFRAMFELASIGMGQADPQTGQWLRVNQKLCAITGYSADEMLRLRFSEITHPEDRQKQWEAHQRIVCGEAPDYRLEKRYVRKDGSIAWVNVNVTVIRDAVGQPFRTMSTIEDITERKRLEEERNRMELQLRQSQKLQAIGHLAAGISHEINTPVQFIGDNTRFLGEIFGGLDQLLAKCAELIEAGRTQSVTPELVAECSGLWEAADVNYLRAEIPSALHQTLEGIERISKIVRAMKDFSHPGTEEKALVDLNKLIESTLTVSRNEWKYVADLVKDFDPTLTAVPCLPGEFNQVILNLVVNAAHAMGDASGPGSTSKGILTVTSRRIDGWAEVRIADTGTGIPESARPHIFEPFFTTKEAGRGTGQGLAIAHSVITEQHGGTIRFETEVGKGTTFILRLPLAVSTTAKGAPKATPAMVSGSAAATENETVATHST